MSTTFESIMNYKDGNETINNTQKKINQNELSTVDNSIELYELQSEIDSSFTALEMSINSLNRTYDLIDILKHNKLSKKSIKLLSIDKLYKDIYKLPIPSIESYNNDNTQLIVALESVIGKGIQGIKKAYFFIINNIKKLWRKFMDWWRSYEKKVRALEKDVLKKELDLNKIGDTTIKLPMDPDRFGELITTVDDIFANIEKAAKEKVDTTEEAKANVDKAYSILEEKEVKLKDILPDIVKGHWHKPIINIIVDLEKYNDNIESANKFQALFSIAKNDDNPDMERINRNLKALKHDKEIFKMVISFLRPTIITYIKLLTAAKKYIKA